MNKLDALFEQKREDILSIFFTGGFPIPDKENIIIESLEESKVDMVEVGIPFSDPIADGPVIQNSSSTAIENGTTLEAILEELKKSKTERKMPVVLMGYLNSIYKFGIEQFCKAAFNAGIDGLIIPDLPIEEYLLNYKSIFNTYNLHCIFLVSPQTSIERLKYIDSISTSFIYAVSSNSVTGENIDISTQQEYYKRLKEHLNKPFLVGFGIKDKESFENACKYSNGAIVGSAFVRTLEESKDLKIDIKEFISKIKN